MELFPIIYTTLIVFLIITVVTIISSYVTYKVKRKTSNEDEKDKEKFTALHQNATTAPKVIKRKKKPAPKQPQTHNVQKSSEEQKITHKREKQEPVPRRKETKIVIEKPERINILNKPNNNTHPPKPSVKEKKNDKYHLLGDDILDKYSEDDDDDFHSLNATRDDE